MRIISTLFIIQGRITYTPRSPRASFFFILSQYYKLVGYYYNYIDLFLKKLFNFILRSIWLFFFYVIIKYTLFYFILNTFY